MDRLEHSKETKGKEIRHRHEDILNSMCERYMVSGDEWNVDWNDDLDLNNEVEKICEAIKEFVCPYESRRLVFGCRMPYVVKIFHLCNTQGNWATRSRFLAFCKQYRSKFDEFIKWYSRPGVYPIESVLPRDDDCGAKTIPHFVESYKNFKRFDMVEDFSDHLFSASPSPKDPRGKEHMRKIIDQELEILKEGLPDTIYVRAYKSRPELLRAVIIGPKGTPYHDGLFFLDMFVPLRFPYQPPVVRICSGGLGINPHMLACGEFRVELHRSWDELYTLIWEPYGTMLNFLEKIEAFVLNAEPLFLQPGFIDSGPSVVTEYFSLLYNENILIKSLKIMTYIMNNPPKNFEAFVVGHFRNRVLDILEACGAYINGRQVSGVIDCCSIEFQNDVASCMAPLVDAFDKIGATEAKRFGAPTPVLSGDIDMDGHVNASTPSSQVLSGDVNKDGSLNQSQVLSGDVNKDGALNDAADKTQKVFDDISVSRMKLSHSLNILLSPSKAVRSREEVVGPAQPCKDTGEASSVINNLRNLRL